MLHEYAIEPAVLSQFNAVWQALEQFGVPHGRLISTFPEGGFVWFMTRRHPAPITSAKHSRCDWRL